MNETEPSLSRRGEPQVSQPAGRLPALLLTWTQARTGGTHAGGRTRRASVPGAPPPTGRCLLDGETEGPCLTVPPALEEDSQTPRLCYIVLGR